MGGLAFSDGALDDALDDEASAFDTFGTGNVQAMIQDMDVAASVKGEMFAFVVRAVLLLIRCRAVMQYLGARSMFVWATAAALFRSRFA